MNGYNVIGEQREPNCKERERIGEESEPVRSLRGRVRTDVDLYAGIPLDK